MKSAELQTKQRAEIQGSWLDSVCRSIVIRMLQQIKIGQLTLEDNGEVLQFGDQCGDHNLRAHIFVNHPAAYRMVLMNGTIGSGEAYMLNAWHSPDLLMVIRLMVLNMEMLQKMDSNWSFAKKILNRITHRFRSNSRTGSRKNISAHYDLGNHFFGTFLDQTMLYSSAIYPSAKANLYDASVHKMQRICERLNLTESDHLLEIGTGWGGMAIYAAKHFGCKVTSATISKEQFEHACEWVRREGLEQQVTIVLKDYRELEGQFDKLVSIEMIEAVGHQYYTHFFRTCSELLKPKGIMLIQCITIADQRYELEKNNVDFIQQYIFPGGCLPSVSVIMDHIARCTDMQLYQLEDITRHYAQTLADWRKRFFQNINDIKQQGFSDVFVRMWDFYLCYCEGGFRERVIATSQMLFVKPRFRELNNV